MHANPSHDSVKTDRTGSALIESPLLNKGTAFSEEERREFGLLGLLPPHVDTLEQQVGRAYEAFCAKSADLEKHIFLRQLQDENETLFYRLLLDHVTEMMPIVYTMRAVIASPPNLLVSLRMAEPRLKEMRPKMSTDSLARFRNVSGGPRFKMSRSRASLAS